MLTTSLFLLIALGAGEPTPPPLPSDAPSAASSSAKLFEAPLATGGTGLTSPPAVRMKKVKQLNSPLMWVGGGVLAAGLLVGAIEMLRWGGLLLVGTAGSVAQQPLHTTWPLLNLALPAGGLVLVLLATVASLVPVANGFFVIMAVQSGQQGSAFGIGHDQSVAYGYTLAGVQAAGLALMGLAWLLADEQRVPVEPARPAFSVMPGSAGAPLGLTLAGRWP